ncbi:GntR family transcriptional regulator [Chenggangzhangella methanolivorans]|uniref:GntR family transcriptional regulator n=1 Tax=Chenggangzhangella methanolivorans TaxID=1437009 RepID=A0A9E6RA42_9HYPH|nr:GntR family transcriptional regulator [Chenggangzhangella methanolivorans]QZO00944.1 GntR family transcriptional regulator [Chenggangzhangella methanolivorans]
MTAPATTETGAAAEEGLGFRPLYAQVRDRLIRRLVDGVWAPGEPLPSEMQLAAELGVSQGTVRKALDAMAAENLVVRRQGRGTFVARHDEERIMFQFFKLVGDDGARTFPQSRVLSVSAARANAGERDALKLERDAKVVRIRRLRSFGETPAIVETLTLPETIFPGLSAMEIPNNLYGLYAMHFGVTVASTRERIKAVATCAQDAETLGVPAGTPALKIDRLALSIERQPVEWRVSVCLTERFHYLSELR